MMTKLMMLMIKMYFPNERNEQQLKKPNNFSFKSFSLFI